MPGDVNFMTPLEMTQYFWCVTPERIKWCYSMPIIISLGSSALCCPISFPRLHNSLQMSIWNHHWNHWLSTKSVDEYQGRNIFLPCFGSQGPRPKWRQSPNSMVTQAQRARWDTTLPWGSFKLNHKCSLQPFRDMSAPIYSVRAICSPDQGLLPYNVLPPH